MMPGKPEHSRTMTPEVPAPAGNGSDARHERQRAVCGRELLASGQHSGIQVLA
jgi:hypothetical protein